MNKKEFIDLIKESSLDKINTIYDDNKSFKIEIEGTRKDMVKTKEKGFNEIQIKQLIEIINATVPPIVVKIINETVPPMIDKAINEFRKEIKQEFDAIKSCPTIAKELAPLQNNNIDKLNK